MSNLPSNVTRHVDASMVEQLLCSGASGVSIGKFFEQFLPLARERLKICVALFRVFVIESWEMRVIEQPHESPDTVCHLKYR